MQQITYITKGTCSRQIDICYEKNTLVSVSFKSGCSGNLQGISKLVEGMPIEEVIRKLKGINCGGKGTSCPDQLARALESILENTDKSNIDEYELCHVNS
ncbi:MAG TPA: TIGR03905 family TSCPD domain-containing protein [Clostridiales bacterium]|nr:TIGR03905 family TSCPD domain-containing protein [Clostridiales bacterium]